MAFTLSIPLTNAAALSITVDHEAPLFVLGANGSGKSSLLHRIYSSHAHNAVRISAHRQTWFVNENAVTLSRGDKFNIESNIPGQDASPQARWTDPFAQQRAAIAINNLISTENDRSRLIARAVDGRDHRAADSLASTRLSPLSVINEMMRSCNLPIEIELLDGDSIAAKKRSGTAFSIAQLSDGERNALVMAASVLSAKPGNLIIIDEPERHLHRSIISPLLLNLFSKRKDCCFVISTHEIMLAADTPESKCLILRDCLYNGSQVVSWDVDILESVSDVDERTKIDLLGSRRTIIFVEGEHRSLDQPLYGIMFGDVSVIPKGNCRDVENAVTGLRESNNLHWVRAFGIVDNDRRATDDLERLQAKGVYAVPFFSVESVYYHPEIQRRTATRHAEVTGDDAAERLRAAREALLAATSASAPHLAARITERMARDLLLSKAPRRRQISSSTKVDIALDVGELFDREEAVLADLVSTGNCERIIAEYPIRETSAIGDIVRALGFADRAQYEGAVRMLLVSDVDALKFVRSIFGSFVQALDGPVAATTAS